VRASPMPAAAAETCSSELRTAGYFATASLTASRTVSVVGCAAAIVTVLGCPATIAGIIKMATINAGALNCGWSLILVFSIRQFLHQLPYKFHDGVARGIVVRAYRGEVIP